MGGYIIILIVFVLFLLYALDVKGKLLIRIKYFHIYIMLFGAYCSLSSIWSLRPTWSFNKGIDILEILFAMTIIYFCFQKDNSIKSILKVIMYANYAVVAYAFIYYGWSSLYNMLSSSTRISNEAINANSLGICAAYAILINMYFIFQRGLKWTDLLMLPSVLIIAVSGSRKALILIVLGTIFLYILKNWNNKNVIKSFQRIGFTLIILVALFYFILQLDIFENLKERMHDLLVALFLNDGSRTNSAWIRLEYNRLGLSLFKSHPLFGIGIGSANVYTLAYYGHDHYLHNNYIELLACGGIVGFLLYYSIYVVILYRMFITRNKRSPEYDLCLVLIILALFMDYGMVTYFDKSTYFYLFLFWYESELLLKNNGVLDNGKTL